MPEPGSVGYVEWVARWHPVPLVRMCAHKAIAVVAEQEACDARLRKVVREELQRVATEMRHG